MESNLDGEIKRTNNFIITGTPGSGKTSLIRRLQMQGFDCFDEPARQILAEQRAMKGEGVPEKDKNLFVALMLSRAISAFEQSLSSDGSNFFDRGIPDNIAYASLFGTECQTGKEAARKYRSNDFVFFLRPWKEIFCNDDERKMTFPEAERFSQIIENVYSNLGYQIIEVPLETVDLRAEFIFERLSRKRNHQYRWQLL
jgi:predicted ATPase